MALNYSEELLKWSTGGGDTRVVQLHSFPQVTTPKIRRHHIVDMFDKVLAHTHIRTNTHINRN